MDEGGGAAGRAGFGEGEECPARAFVCDDAPSGKFEGSSMERAQINTAEK